MYTDTITHIASGAVSSPSFEVGGLAEKGQYTFNLRARNARGWSPPGQMSTLITMPSCGALKPQQPPKPTLALRKPGPMRGSLPMPLRTWLTSAPMISHRLAMSFMNEILVASMALAAYLVISADGMSINSTGWPFRVKGL
jgi:hypothetical protein